MELLKINYPVQDFQSVEIKLTQDEVKILTSVMENFNRVNGFITSEGKELFRSLTNLRHKGTL